MDEDLTLVERNKQLEANNAELLARNRSLEEQVDRLECAVLVLRDKCNELSGESADSSDLFMKKVLENIRAHFSESTFTVKVLADSLGVSLPTLYRRVKNVSLSELIRTARLEKAAELLPGGQYSVLEISELVGFNDVCSFRKRFVEYYGCLPSVYVATRKS